MTNKTFFLKLIYFLVPIVVVITVLEIRLRGQSNSYSYKSELLEQKTDLQILVLGNSEAYYDFNPAKFSVPGFNLANTSQSLEIDHQLVERFIKRLPKLKVIVLSLSYFSFEYRLYGNEDDYREFYYPYFYGIAGDGGIASWLDVRRFFWLAGLGPDLTKKILFENYNRNLENEVSTDGWFNTEKSNYPHNPISDAAGKARADYHTSTIKPSLTRVNIAAIETLVALAKDHGVRMALVRPPAFATYTTYLNKSAEKRFDDNVKGLEERLGLRFVDYLRDTRFGRDDYYDNDHLNSRGAEKLSGIVDREVLVPLLSGAEVR